VSSLLELERSAVAVCLDAEPAPAAMARLGEPRIWAIYREMVRNRLRKELQLALKQTYRAVGEQTFERLFTQQLAHEPPRARPFHAVVGCFARFAEPRLRADADVPAHAPDLLAYEAALWEVADLPDQLAHEPLELAFDRPVVLARALRLLHLQHAVHEPPRGSDDYEAREVFVCVYRPADAKKATTWSLNAVTFALMQRWACDEGQSVTAAVQHVAAERALVVDDAFLEGLCTVLADFLERGIVLGSRAG
jgi:hypothetical protein